MKLGSHSYFLGTDHGDDTVVGNFSSIAGGTYIHGPDNHACVLNHDLVSCFDFGDFGADFTKSGQARKTVTIGNDVWIGEHVQILSGVNIGDGVIVGAHTVVGKDVPPYAVIVGNPYKIVRYRFSPKIIEVLLRIKWWNWDDGVIRERLSNFRNIHDFVKQYG